MDKYFTSLDFFGKFSDSVSKSNSQNNNNFSVLIVIGVAAFIIALIILYYYFKDRFNLSSSNYVKRHNFNSLAKTIGLENEESKILFNLAEKNYLKEPLSCFTNSKTLDDLIKQGIRDIEKNEKIMEDEKVGQSSILLEIKAKIERNTKQNIGIKSTHLLHENQKMVIFAREKGYIYAIIKKVLHDYIVIELMSEKIKSRILSTGEHLKIYFWREEDAGYTFDTSIIGFDNNIKRYSIKHSETLSRTQKRRYRRIPVNISGHAIPVDMQFNGKIKKYIPKENLAVTCNIKNLSAGGLLMIVNNLKSNDKNIKIVFDLNHNKIGVIGKIIRIHHVHEHLYEVTIQFVRMLLKEKNIINKYVYNYMPGYD